MGNPATSPALRISTAFLRISSFHFPALIKSAFLLLILMLLAFPSMSKETVQTYSPSHMPKSGSATDRLMSSK